MSAYLNPTNEVVTASWLRSIGFANVGATLPVDKSTWASGGFVQVSVVSGAPSIYFKMGNPVFQIDCWATSATSSAKAPYGKANEMAEAIKEACINPLGSNIVALLTTEDLAPSSSLVPTNPIPGNLTLPGNFKPARILSAYCLTEPRRQEDPNSSFARYSLQLQLHWTA